MQNVSRHFVRQCQRAFGLIALTLLLGAMVGCGDSSDEPQAESSQPVRGTSMSQLENEDEKPANRLTHLVPAKVPAPRPTAPLPAGASCVTPECHASLVTARHVHAPVGQGSCETCHASDTGEHKYPLKRSTNETCTFCHQVTGAKAHQHGAMKNFNCIACHDPHASRTDHLLTAESVEQLCAKCHIQPIKKFAHQPFLEGKCTQCHQPHESDYPNLLRGGAGAKHCALCHEQINLAIENSPVVHEPAKKDCLTCHAAHTSDFPAHLKHDVQDTCLSCHEKMATQIKNAAVGHDAVSIKSSCANCHDPHATDRGKLLKGLDVDLCMQCHNEKQTAPDGRAIPSFTAMLERKYLHGPVKSGDCAACHNPHGSANPRLLEKKFPEGFYTDFDIKKYELCFSCHDRQLVLMPETNALTNFRDGDRNLHYVHVHRDSKGRSCKTCHNVHASNLPNHMAESVPFEGSNWSMMINYEKSEQGGSCAPGCHEPMRYDRGDSAAPSNPRGAP